MFSKELKFLRDRIHSVNNHLGSLFGKFSGFFNNVFHGAKIPSFKYSHRYDGEGIQDIAEILANMVFIGKEKRNLCEYYNLINGLCQYIKLDIDMPTMTTVKEGNAYRLAVSIHPEVCAVCPFWHRKNS